MSDPSQLAKSARELLAKALNALQSNAHVPDELMAVAEPIADAMGLLHRIERSEGRELEGRDAALVFVRGALDALQKVDVHHPALDTVMECVATSLSKVHALTRAQPIASASAPAPAAAIAAAPVVAVAAAPAAIPVDIPPPPAAVYAQAQAAAPASNAFGGTEAFPAPQAGAMGPRGTMAMQNSPLQAQPASQQPNPSPPIKTPFTAMPAQAAQAQPASAPAPQAPPVPAPTPIMQQAPAPAARSAPPASSAKAPKVAGSIDVELGTHSSSNFYKGLGGNDVIDHGGIFVATYKIPKIGATVTLRVLLPGDLEFQASAVVQWTREASGSAEPGYGARFTQITQEGRHLVYRYTRNREPMFYDDL